MTLALYIHIPYCKQKCPYCDFNSYPGAINEKFVDAIKEEINFKSKDTGFYQVQSVFFGGGTPTILPADQIIEILDCCSKNFSIATDCEISIEANPGTVDYEYFEILKEFGFSRLSLGCQSFDDEMLKGIGRIHNCGEIYQSFSSARKAGFNNISLDLMFGLPGQTLQLWEETLKKAVDLKPNHLSVYNLTLEKGMPFYDQHQKGELKLPSEEMQLEMYEKAIEILNESDFDHYEISNFAKKGFECRHNLVYWNNKEYLGFGPGAASYTNGTRTMNVLSPDEYIHTLLEKKENPLYETEKLDQKKSMGETLILGLRMLRGVNIKDFEKRYGKKLDPESNEKIKKLCDDKLLEYDKEHLKLSHRGVLFSNEVFVELV